MFLPVSARAALATTTAETSATRAHVAPTSTVYGRRRRCRDRTVCTCSGGICCLCRIRSNCRILLRNLCRIRSLRRVRRRNRSGVRSLCCVYYYRRAE